MTDERQGSGLMDAIARLPEGAGIVFRHYGLPEKERRALFDRVRAASARRGLTLLLAGPAEEAMAWGAAGSHGRGPGQGLRTAPAHGLAEIRAAEEAGASLIFLSPVFPTRSHPGSEPLGLSGLRELSAQTALPLIALGGMNAERAKDLDAWGAYGWAGIDAWDG